MIVLFRIQDINELNAHIDLASMLQSKMFGSGMLLDRAGFRI